MSYADVNGIRLYYEEQGTGSGPALILLHPGFGSTESFTELAPTLSADRRVILVDLQGHGRTADVDRPMRFETMADDIAELIRHLGLEQADLMGYSLGGSVAARTAMQHPEVVRRLVLVSVPVRHRYWFPEVREGMGHVGPNSAEMMKQSPLYEVYTRVAPRVEDWQNLHVKMGKLISSDYDWSEETRALRMPVLLIAADSDSFPTSAAAEFYALLGGGQKDADWDYSGQPINRLAVIPGATHYDIGTKPIVARFAVDFLDADFKHKL